jgi:16S rRNA (guanine966-N2)-methyltransferase
MRIVAGSVGGRTLRVPATGTRPTSDRVREALFSRLEHLRVIDGARVLDLFAGSGALGIEAASRGAGAVTLVDSGRAAVEACRQNVAGLALAGVTVVAERAERFVRRPVPAGWDLVFLDPPYELADDLLADVLLGLAGTLAAGALVVVERSGRSPEPRWPDGLTGTSSRTYGDTIVWFAAADPTARRADRTPAAVEP